MSHVNWAGSVSEILPHHSFLCKNFVFIWRSYQDENFPYEHQGFIKGWVLDKLTSCGDDFASLV